MSDLEVIQLSPVDLKKHPEINEAYIQQYIAENPRVLGFGDNLELRGKEKRQPQAGRLDLLFADRETDQFYEVEIQLGSTDPSHIIRTIEYWDKERKRYPDRKHCAVLIAEDLTGRFFNVIQLFNGYIPLIAIQMKAFEVNGQIALTFTRVLDELTIVYDDEDEEAPAPADRSFWEAKVPKESLSMADEICRLINEFDPDVQLKYNKGYIGLSKAGLTFNFIFMVPQKKCLCLYMWKDEVYENLLNDSDLLPVDRNGKHYCIRLQGNDISENKEVLRQLLKQSQTSYTG